MTTEITEALRAKADAVPHSPMPLLGHTHRRRWPVPVAAAATVVVAAVAAVFVFSANDKMPDKVVASPPTTTTATIAPGEVYYSLRLTDLHAGGYLRETQLWQPQDRTGEWRQQVVDGQSIKDGRVVPSGGRVEAPPGGVCYPAFHATDGSCTSPGSWFNPTLDFLATAPRDPATIADQLHAEAIAVLHRNGQGDELASLLELKYIGEVLSSNGVPPELPAAMAEVAKRLPGVTVTNDMANLTGQRGTGYSIPNPKGGSQSVIFGADGRYLGSPTEVVRHGVAPGLGRPPSRMLD